MFWDSRAKLLRLAWEWDPSSKHPWLTGAVGKHRHTCLLWSALPCWLLMLSVLNVLDGQCRSLEWSLFKSLTHINWGYLWFCCLRISYMHCSEFWSNPSWLLPASYCPIPTTSLSHVHELLKPPSIFNVYSICSGYKSCVFYKKNSRHAIFICVSNVTDRYFIPLCNFPFRIVWTKHLDFFLLYSYLSFLMNYCLTQET